VKWRPVQNADWDFQIPVTEYIVERLRTSSEGWVQLLRAPIGSIAFDGQFYSFVDQTASPGTDYAYGIAAVVDGFRTWRFTSASDVVPVDLTFLDYDYNRNPPHLRDVPDADEESKGYFIPLNNNFDEQNTDAFGMLLRDNEADTTSGHRILNTHLNHATERQLTTLSVSRYGSNTWFDTLKFEFPPAIKLWVYEVGDWSGTAFEIISGTLYNIFDLQEQGYEFLVEGISESQSIRDVEIKVTATSELDPNFIEIDKLRVTIGNLRAEIPSEIDADTGEIFAYVPITPYTTEFDGETVTLNLRRDGTVVETQEGTIEDGQVAVIFPTSHVADGEYTVETVFRGQRGMSDALRLVAGAPESIQAVASKTKYVADGTDVTTITATIRDQFGNLVEDGTPVSWTIPFGEGLFSNGSTTAATETSNGQASITLQAPDRSDIQHVVATAATAKTSIDIAAEAANFQLNGVAALDIATGQSGTVTITNANVVNGTPVFWTLSNGQIAGGQEGGRVYAGVVNNGTASINVQATGPWARVGLGVVTATIAGRLYHHQINFDRSGPFSVEIEQLVLAGDVPFTIPANEIAYGIEPIDYEDSNPMWQGQPAWGFGPPPQNWPLSRNVGYYAETPVTIRGAAFQTYYIIVDTVFTSFAQFLGLGAANEIQLDANGIGTFKIRSKGQLASDQFLPIEFTVRQGTLDPFVGAPQTVERGMLVDHDWYTRTVDFSYGFIGGDPTGVSGIAGGFAGSLLLIGDAGSLVKNGWRAAGKSDEPVNKAEVALGTVGILTTLTALTGDTPVAAIRSLIAATDGVKLGQILAGFLARSINNIAELNKLGAFALKVMSSDAALHGAKEALTSEALVEASIHAVDKLGNSGAAFLVRIGRTVDGPGIKVAQDVTTLFGRLSDDSLNFFKNINADQLNVAIDHLGTILRSGKVDIAQLRKLFDNNQLFTAAYDRTRMISDLSILSDSEGIGKLVNHLKSETLAGPIQGRLYELQTAAKVVDDHSQEGWKIKAIVDKYAKEIDPITGKRLRSTDIDFIIDDGTNLIFYQAKSSATAFGDVADTQRWLQIVRADARRNGVTNQVIRYVTPDPNSVPSAVAQFLTNQGILIDPSPLLR
jgi:hypothetical protein